MRLCVTCVYWTLLLVSVISSGLLFLIVASEGIQVPERQKGITQEDNIPVEDVASDRAGGDFASPEVKVPEVYPRPTVKTEQEHLHSEESDGKEPSQENSWKDHKSERNVDVLKESLTQQPNLSQGISETGQAVVLTLVDTATAELQSLAEPRLTAEIRSRTSVKNATLTTSTTTTTTSAATTATRPVAASTTATTTTTTSSAIPRDPEEDPITQHPEELHSSDLPSVLISSELSKNFTEVEATEVEVVTLNDEITEDLAEHAEVLTVRAEQKIVEDISTRSEEAQDEEVTEDVTVKPEENLTASAELDDGAARARLVGGSAEEAAAVILDGLVTSGPTDHHHEDIPSFSEWAQKRLEEAEKKKTHPNASIQNPGGLGRGVGGMKVRSKNYASPDCGAKIVAVNPEARSARSVLVSTRDEYMLNTCTSRVWFVVELCEAIQAKKIELANFELFSSSPKDFSVFVSDRFPTRDWSPVGQFTAKDQRDIQSFALHPQLFGKFIKVELHSHYGSEHFCPISLFRTYGTSEFEVLETETDHPESENDDDDEDDEDDPLDSESGAESRNLFGSARDAVLRIVKKAAEVLVKTGDPSNKNNITKIQESIEDNILEISFATCTTPRYTITCANCSDDLFAGVFELLSCRASHLDALLTIPFVNETLRSCDICKFHGVDISSPFNENSEHARRELLIDEESSRSKFHLVKSLRASFLASIFSPEYLVALCNVIATKERKLVLNASYELNGNSSVASSTKIDASSGKIESPESNGELRAASAPSCPTDAVSGTCKHSATTREAKATRIQGQTTREQEIPTSSPLETTTTSSENLAAQIKPTKTLSREDTRKDTQAPVLEVKKETNEENTLAEVLTTPSPVLNLPTTATRDVEEPASDLNVAESTTTGTTSTVSLPSSVSRETQDVSNGHDETNHESLVATKRLMENGELDGKHAKQESGEQEAKLTAQEQMSLDSILSDLKDLEGDAAGIQGTGGHNANVNVAHPTASNTPQQKESVFLRLSNRIKALERNMSLSGQYLEELSKRYKKQVEEMQRSLERATAVMSEESRKGEERELRRLEEISALREKITSLTQSLDILLYDRNSWRSKLSTICQHFALIVVEIVVLMFVISYCRRNSEFEDADESRGSVEEVTRRRSAGAMSTVSPTTKKAQKRRPSEIASRITGTYGDLMIDDRSGQESKKEKKKRRKRELNGRTLTNSEKEVGSRVDEGMPGGTELPSRRSSSIDPPSNHAKQLELSQMRKRPDSAPEYSGGWFFSKEKNSQAKKTESNDEQAEKKSKNERRAGDEPSQENSTNIDENQSKDEGRNNATATLFRGGGILKAAKLSSPSFMKTALGSRSKRNAKSNNGKGDHGPQLKSDNWEWYSRNSGNRSDGGSPGSSRTAAGSSSDGHSADAGATNGHHRNPSDESGSSSATNIPAIKKDKKSGGGIRKMVRKLF